MVIFNRECCGDDLRDLAVRVSDEKPSAGEDEIFSGGSLFGKYDGWGQTGQVITMEQHMAHTGRYVVVQHNVRGYLKWLEEEKYWSGYNKEKQWAAVMDLGEVKVFGYE